MIQFGTRKFRRTSKNYFGQFVWIEKSHYNSRVSLHEAPTKKHFWYWISSWWYFLITKFSVLVIFSLEILSFPPLICSLSKVYVQLINFFGAMYSFPANNFCDILNCFLKVLIIAGFRYRRGLGSFRAEQAERTRLLGRWLRLLQEQAVPGGAGVSRVECGRVQTGQCVASGWPPPLEKLLQGTLWGHAVSGY